jgi:hypothetical protein
VSFDPDDSLEKADRGMWDEWFFIAGEPGRRVERAQLMAILDDVDRLAEYTKYPALSIGRVWDGVLVLSILDKAEEKIRKIWALNGLIGDEKTKEHAYSKAHLEPAMRGIGHLRQRIAEYRTVANLRLLTPDEVKEFCSLSPVNSVFSLLPFGVEISIIMYNVVEALRFLRECVAGWYDPNRYAYPILRNALRPYGNNLSI